jgi:hypothetical protein
MHSSAGVHHLDLRHHRRSSLSRDQLLCYGLASIAISTNTPVDIPPPAWVRQIETLGMIGRVDCAVPLTEIHDHTVGTLAAWVSFLSEMVSSGL